jgi:hypothetical protein
VAGVAYLTLKVHVPPTASGVMKEQVFAGTVYKPPMLSRRFSAVICKGPVPVLVTVTTLVTGARGVGIVNVRVRTPPTVVSVPLLAEAKLNVPCGTTTVKVTLLLVPAGVVTLTLWAPSAVAAAMVKVAVTVVAFTTVTLLTVMFGEFTTVTAVVPVRLVPLRVTETLVPRAPVLGVIEVSVGAGGI